MYFSFAVLVTFFSCIYLVVLVSFFFSFVFVVFFLFGEGKGSILSNFVIFVYLYFAMPEIKSHYYTHKKSHLFLLEPIGCSSLTEKKAVGMLNSRKSFPKFTYEQKEIALIIYKSV